MCEEEEEEEEPLPELDMSKLNHPKYLKEMLAKVKTPSAKASIYLKYLSNCHFNTYRNPDSIILFTEGDVRKLAGIDEDPGGADQVLKQVNYK